MCGRFVSSNAPAALADFFGTDVPDVELPPRFNVAPTNDVYGVVASANQVRSLEVFRWGLLPSWAKEARIGSSMINARAETVHEKRSFVSSFRSRRLIVPMSGFYEWTTSPIPGGRPAKLPFFIHRVDDEPLAVAGLWSAWRDPAGDGSWLHTCAVITTAANATMSAVHDRMPALLDRAVWDEWLDPTNDDLPALMHLLQPAAEGVLTMHRVGVEVNKVQHKGPELILPVAEPIEAP